MSRYVEWEWQHGRHILEEHVLGQANRRVLEYGSYLGATAIIMARLGAQVTACDIDLNFLRAAMRNARRYGVQDRIRFVHAPDVTKLPFSGEAFDVISCASVLEYVPWAIRLAAQRELDRVLSSRGVIVISGTSNRLWPREAHTRRWLSNYVPRVLDRLRSGEPQQRGVSPFAVRRGFGRYEDIYLLDRGRAFIAAKARMGVSRRWLRPFWMIAWCASHIGVSAGMFPFALCLVLRKRPSTGAASVSPADPPRDIGAVADT